eukprot:607306-Rhodomonas_salina.1
MSGSSAAIDGSTGSIAGIALRPYKVALQDTTMGGAAICSRSTAVTGSSEAQIGSTTAINGSTTAINGSTPAINGSTCFSWRKQWNSVLGLA